MAFFSGLDLGKRQDRAALGVLDRQPLAAPVAGRRWRYECRHLEAWPLGTQYGQVVADVKARFQHPELRGSKLAPDYGGVGVAVCEQITRERVPAVVRPILTTSGSGWRYDEADRVYHVPKADLVTTLVMLMGAGLLVVDAGLRFAAELKQELKRYQEKYSDKGNVLYGAEGAAVDDLVTSLMLAAWLGEHAGGGIADGIGVPEPGRGSVLETATAGTFAVPAEYTPGVDRGPFGGDR